MAMDDTYALASAIVTNRGIQLKTLDGKVLKAHVIMAVISCDHTSGTFCGSVNFLVEGEEYVRIEPFYKMWVAGWEPLQYSGE